VSLAWQRMQPGHSYSFPFAVHAHSANGGYVVAAFVRVPFSPAGVDVAAVAVASARAPAAADRHSAAEVVHTVAAAILFAIPQRGCRKRGCWGG